MFKVDKIKSFFDCDHCHNQLADPVTIACGKNVCKIHLDDLVANLSETQNTFECTLCQEEHFIPKQGFVV